MTDLVDPRYPIGRFTPPESSTLGVRAAQIQTLRELPERLRIAVDGLDDMQLDTPYREGGWTVRQLVHHIADSHANAYIRCKLALTENWPTIKPYDEAAWAKLPDSLLLPIGVSLTLIDALHPESGRQNLATVLAVYEWHSRHHTAHITQLRLRQNW